MSLVFVCVLIGIVGGSLSNQLNSIEACVGSNDARGATSAFRALRWDEGSAEQIAGGVARLLPSRKEFLSLRRELKTKYELLREPENTDIPELSEVQSYPIAVVDIEVITVPTIKQEVVDVVAVAAGPLSASPSSLIIFEVRDLRFLAAMDAWKKRWGVVENTVGMEQARFVPHPETAMGRRRTALMTKIMHNGWTKQTDSEWRQYHEDLAKALKRRATKSKR